MKNVSTASLAKRRINCTFYPVIRPELIWMRANKLINNTAFVYMALRLENPHCDRPVDINVKEFAISWTIPESSVYEALAKLKDLKALKFLNKKVRIQWEQGFDLWNSESPDSQQEHFSGNPEFITESQNLLRNPRINSEPSENQTLKPLPVKGSDSLQNIQTFSDTTDSKEVVIYEFLEKEEQEVQEREPTNSESPKQISNEDFGFLQNLQVVSDTSPAPLPTPVPPIKPCKKELPRQEELRQMGVKLDNSELLRTVAAYQGEIINPIRAFLEYARNKQVKNSTTALTTAIRQDWKPDRNYEDNGLPKEQNAPTPEQIAKLEELKFQGKIADFYLSSQDGITKVIPFREVLVGKEKRKMANALGAIPWWEVLV